MNAIIRDPTPKDIALAWKEVDCFLRPQSMCCEELCRGQGLALALLYSIYRSGGLGGYFTDPEKQYFAFARQIFQAFSQLEFQVTRVEQRAKILPALIEALEAGGPAIVPANIRALPYFNRHGEEDRAHHFITTGVDVRSQTFAVYDNLHATGDPMHAVYSAADMRFDVLSSIVEGYWDTYIAQPADTPHRERSYWILKIRPGAGFEPQPELQVLRRLVDECATLMQSVQPGDTLSTVDRRYIVALRQAGERRDMGALNKLIRTYLRESNLATVHIKIAIHALDCLGAPAAGALASDFEAYKEASSAVRTKLFVRCVARGQTSERDWEGSEAELVQGAGQLVRRFLAAAALA